MTDDLISRRETLEILGEPHPLDYNTVAAVQKIIALPAVEAVPLDKLCEWMNVHCGRPNDCNGRLCGECNLDGEGFEYETCWKILLTEWMEEQQNE